MSVVGSKRASSLPFGASAPRTASRELYSGTLMRLVAWRNFGGRSFVLVCSSPEDARDLRSRASGEFGLAWSLGAYRMFPAKEDETNHTGTEEESRRATIGDMRQD